MAHAKLMLASYELMALPYLFADNPNLARHWQGPECTWNVALEDY